MALRKNRKSHLGYCSYKYRSYISIFIAHPYISNIHNCTYGWAVSKLQRNGAERKCDDIWSSMGPLTLSPIKVTRRINVINVLCLCKVHEWSWYVAHLRGNVFNSTFEYFTYNHYNVYIFMIAWNDDVAGASIVSSIFTFMISFICLFAFHIQ